MSDLTHEVFNQPEPLVHYNLFEGNRAMRDALKLNAPRLDTAELSALGAMLGTGEMQTHARLANVHTPRLRSHDRFAGGSTRSNSTRLSRADGRGDPGRVARFAVEPAQHLAARAASGRLHVVHGAGAVDPLPDFDDLCGHPGAAPQ